MKKWIIVIAAILTCGSGLFAQQQRGEPSIEILFFHEKNPCGNCFAVMDVSNDVLDKYFAKEREKGDIHFQSFSFEDPLNAEIVERYGISKTTYILVHHTKKKKDKIINLTEEATSLAVPDPAKLRKLLRKEINGFFR